ncbi:MAG: ParB N-terminal domain-containing protein [Lentisphaerae bacterium]|jgi:hypothetical protein|nr:ParB N-terminal domain-containing protein [Lentisphaerota bacterium]MBT5608060.1 ParB N-terminal domain-containing protein [Lentisphaerota bacterium]MBT7056472.1 ParB N-terminal domain-containing protein [Lentisphaerota bacterium]
MTLQEQIEGKKLAEIWTIARIRELGIPEGDAARLAGGIHMWETEETKGQRGNTISTNRQVWEHCRHVAEIEELYEHLLNNSTVLTRSKQKSASVVKPSPKKVGKKTAKLRIADIIRDEATQPRSEMNDAVVAQYAELMQGDTVFPPVVVFHSEGTYVLADGFHRIAAAELAGLEEIESEVREGSRRDAILFALDANSKHGLNWTNADKRRAVTLLLEDEEWSKWSTRVIAGRCGVSHTLVSNLRRELSVNGLQMEERKAVRNGTEYTMQTDRIGKDGAKEVDDTSPAADLEPAAVEALIPGEPSASLGAPTGEDVLLIFLESSNRRSVGEVFQAVKQEFERRWPGLFGRVMLQVPDSTRDLMCEEWGICKEREKNEENCMVECLENEVRRDEERDSVNKAAHSPKKA